MVQWQLAQPVVHGDGGNGGGGDADGVTHRRHGHRELPLLGGDLRADTEAVSRGSWSRQE